MRGQHRKNFFDVIHSGTLGKRDLVRLKMKAVRTGMWTRALNRIDRALVDLTITVASRVRSQTLAKTLLSVVKKLEDAFESRILHMTRTVGFPRARGLSLLAQKWGNRLAGKWVLDESFARFLAVMYVNGLGELGK
jgi:hypothetical protein